MKLAEALILQSDQKKRVAQLRQRLLMNAKVQEDEKPAEDPQALLKEFDEVTESICELLKRINKTNLATVFAKDKTLTDALAEREVLAMRRRMYEELASNAAASVDRYSRSEIKTQSTVNVKQIQKQVDAMAKAYRELDTKIQELNWQTELIE